MKFLGINESQADLIFRMLFSSIFLGLGMEHLFSDDLLQHLMPGWVFAPELASYISGVILLAGGSMILLGYHVRLGASILSVFLIVVTIAVHAPDILKKPDDSNWMWIILQRSNFVKNVCLLGVCFKLFFYTPGNYSLEAWLKRRHR